MDFYLHTFKTSLDIRFSSNNQYHIDVALVPHLHTHPNRIYDASQTNRHILGVIPNAIEEKNRDSVLKNITTWLTSLKEWKNHSNKFGMDIF